jgi:signal transduction histidine kinase
MSTRLSFRLSAPVMAASCLPLLVGAFAAWKLHRSQREAAETLATNARSMRAAEEVAIGVRDVRDLLNRFLLTGNDALLAGIPKLKRDTDRWLEEARRTAITTLEHRLVGELTRAYERFFAELVRLEQLAPAGRTAAARALTGEASDILRPTQQYLDWNEVEIQRISEETRVRADRMALGLLVLGVCGPLTGVCTGFAIARAVNRSVVRLTVPVRDAAGRLSEVVGPVTVSAGMGLEELEAVLRRVADQAGAVVERLQQSEREALRAEQLAALGQMAAGMAHELRNPLMSMKILVQSAAEGLPDPSRGRPAARATACGLAGRDLAVLEEEITRLERLTSSLLAFARPPEPSKRPFVAQALIEDAISLVSGQAGQRDVSLDCDLPQEPVWLEADAGQIRQVVLNLLLNALDVVPDGGSVLLDLEAPPPGAIDPWVTVRVVDSGPGLPAALGRDIFAPFVSTKATGVGLGLSISRRIVEAHGGTIAAADRPGSGAVFTVRLPSAVSRQLSARAPCAWAGEPAG